MEYNIFNSETYTKNICSGEQRLCIAIIIQAIKDIHHCGKHKPYLQHTNPKRVDEDAIRWLLSDRCCPFSFIWCLEHALPDFYDRIDLAKFRKLVLAKPLARNSVNL